MYINFTKMHPVALNLSEEVLLHFEVHWDESTQPNAISINAVKSVRVHGAQGHSSLQRSNLVSISSSAAAQCAANLHRGCQPQAHRGNPAQDNPQQAPGECVLGWDEARQLTINLPAACRGANRKHCDNNVWKTLLNILGNGLPFRS